MTLRGVDRLVALCYFYTMSLPVRLSDALVLDARMTSKAVHRSISGQVEFWASIGRAIEPLLLGEQVIALCRTATARPLSACLQSVDSPEGHRRLADFLKTQPYPHYEPHPDGHGLLIRVDADGKRYVGRFVNRKFKLVEKKGSSR